jgi:hypothetical protein
LKNTRGVGVLAHAAAFTRGILARARIEKRWQNGTDAESCSRLPPRRALRPSHLRPHRRRSGAFLPAQLEPRSPAKGLASAVDRVEEVARWDVRPVSDATS